MRKKPKLKVKKKVKKESLDKLKDINLLTHYGQEIATSLGVVVEGGDEGSVGDTEPQESDDSGLEETRQK